MIIYGSSLSPYVRKTIVFATEKGLDFEVVMAGGQGGPPEFAEASPFKKMPGFKDGDFLISDSTAIITYMDVIKPDPNLIPTEAKSRARTRPRATLLRSGPRTLIGAGGGQRRFCAFCCC